ncbi:hypothetical protein V8G54_021002 [Vigna mungo]|uniref:Ty3-gypsy retrotransposon protein n=1 Tax=Vigna mungo TaxID=3915 RepID=A0AAQ3NER9_VIGMU
MEELRLTVTDTLAYCVSLGDGHRREARGWCDKVTVQLGEVDVKEDFYVFELGGVDVILGVAWLATLGEVSTNWANMTMVYKVGDRRTCIKGDLSLTRHLVKAESLLKVVDAEAGAMVWSLSRVEADDSSEWGTDLTVGQRAELVTLLQTHSHLF